MPAVSHTRVKQVFLEALERRGAARAAYVHKECGSDLELRAAVDGLLAAHRDSTVIVGDLPQLDVQQVRRSAEGSRLLNLVTVLFSIRSRRLIACAVTIAAMLLLGYWTRTQARAMLLTQAGSALRAVLDGNATTLLSSTAEWRAALRGTVGRPDITRALNALVSAPTPTAWRQLDSLVTPQLVGKTGYSYFISSPAGDLIATSAGLATGRATASGMAALGRMQNRDGSIEFPSPGSDFGEPAGQRDIWPRAIVLSPIRGPDGRVTGAFGLTKRLTQTGELTTRGRPFQTGETYLFREDGLLLTPSRFGGDLERWKLAQREGTANMPAAYYLRDPGRSLYTSGGVRADEDPVVWPLTEIVRVAVARRRPSSGGTGGVLLDSYRDYRGVAVVGSWRWMRELNVGMAAEVDEAEILAALRFVDWPIGVTALLLGSAGAWTILTSWLLTRLRNRPLAGASFGPYLLVEKIGEGGMGEVFLAQHALLRRPAALKLLRRDRLSPDFLAQFEREAQSASRLRHPNTVEIYDFGQTRDGMPYYVMEYVPGVDLGKWVAQHGPLTPGRAVSVAKQVCAALVEAHEQHLIHRDIKPANVMLCDIAGQPDFVKILDFGLAKDLTAAAETSPHLCSGTPFYTAPERLTFSAGVDHRCDLYSFGVLLYFLICAEMPYEEASWIEATLSGRLIPPSARVAVPVGVERIILDCLCRDPGGRPASARDLLGRLCALGYQPEGTP